MTAASADMASYMRKYRAQGKDTSQYRQRAPKSAGRVANHVAGHNARSIGEQTLRDEVRRGELRTGGLMWPEADTGEHFKPGQAAARLAAALSRRRRRPNRSKKDNGHFVMRH